MGQLTGHHRYLDADIRQPLLLWLAGQHLGDENIAILEEVNIPRPSARIDVALINGRISGFEIKSDGDNLDRLDSQKHSYNRVFEDVTMVTTAQKIKKIRKRIPDKWGILVYDGNSNFTAVRRPKGNAVDLECLLYVLTNVELKTVISGLKIQVASGVYRKSAYIDVLLNKGQRRKTLRLVREALKLRQ